MVKGSFAAAGLGCLSWALAKTLAAPAIGRDVRAKERPGQLSNGTEAPTHKAEVAQFLGVGGEIVEKSREKLFPGVALMRKEPAMHQ